jgi:VanZ family protein
MAKKKRNKELMGGRWRLFSRFMQFVWVLSIAFVAYLSLTPQIDLPFGFKGIDKVYHSLAYLWLAVIPFLGFQSIKIALVGALLMIPFGIGLEYAQDYVHGRFFSVADMVANGTGVVLGMTLGKYLKSWSFVSYP